MAMKHCIKSFAAVVISLSLSTVVSATKYYFSSEGHDTNSGTESSSAWKSLDKLSDLDLKPGDKILIQGGDTLDGSIYLDDRDAGDPSNPLYITSYGTGKAVIRTSSFGSSGLMIYNTQGIVVSNLIFKGPGYAEADAKKNDGIMLFTDVESDKKFMNIQIINVEVSDFSHFGIAIGSWPKRTSSPGFGKVIIDKCLVHHIRENGIVSFGKATQTSVGFAHRNIKITNTEVHDVTGYSAPIHKGSGIIIAQADSCLIERCVAHDNGMFNTACGGPGGIWAWSCNNITIQYCESYGNLSGTGKGCDGLGFDFDGGVTNSVLQYNYSHDNAGAGYLLGQFADARAWGNNVVRYNISVNDARTNNSPITIFKGPNCTLTGLDLYNNTIVASFPPQNRHFQKSALQITEWFSEIYDINIHNNIFETSGGLPLINVPKNYNAKFWNNIYWTNGGGDSIKYQGKVYTNLNDWREATGNEKNGDKPVGMITDPMLDKPEKVITMAPQFTNELKYYKPKKNSPAINNAINSEPFLGIETCTHDFYMNGFSFGEPFDIGAYESQPEQYINQKLTGNAAIKIEPISPQEVKIEIVNPKKSKAELIITDTNGNHVFSKDCNLEYNHFNKVNLASGLYIVKLISNEISFSGKLVIN
jgi:hypothetical protein